MISHNIFIFMPEAFLEASLHIRRDDLLSNLALSVFLSGGIVIKTFLHVQPNIQSNHICQKRLHINSNYTRHNLLYLSLFFAT